jgi:hypothetical protein
LKSKRNRERPKSNRKRRRRTLASLLRSTARGQGPSARRAPRAACTSEAEIERIVERKVSELLKGRLGALFG